MLQKAKRKEAERSSKEANEAYQVLSDPQKKQQYDQFGHAAFENGGGGFDGAGFDLEIFLGDILKVLLVERFGGFGSSSRSCEPDADLRYTLEISLEEAAQGAEKTIKNIREQENVTFVMEQEQKISI